MSGNAKVEGELPPIHPLASPVYADIRAKWVHEDALINQRVTWLLTSQGFLFTAFGVIVKLRMDAPLPPAKGSDVVLFDIGEVLVVVSALVVSYFLRDGIVAAIRAMEEIKKYLKACQLADPSWRDVRVDILDKISHDGTAPARGMVNTFAILWVLLYLYEVVRLVGTRMDGFMPQLIALSAAAAVIMVVKNWMETASKQKSIIQAGASMPMADFSGEVEVVRLYVDNAKAYMQASIGALAFNVIVAGGDATAGVNALLWTGAGLFLGALLASMAYQVLATERLKSFFGQPDGERSAVPGALYKHAHKAYTLMMGMFILAILSLFASIFVKAGGA